MEPSAKIFAGRASQGIAEKIADAYGQELGKKNGETRAKSSQMHYEQPLIAVPPCSLARLSSRLASYVAD